MNYEVIQVNPATPAIGAHIDAVDLGSDVSDQVFAEIHQALLDHFVLFFSPQNMTPGALSAFAKRFGNLDKSGFVPTLENHPEIIVLSNDRDHPPAVNVWHTDSTFNEVPPRGAVLWARELPPMGGDTMWCSMYAAYDALPDSIKQMLSGLTALHQVDTSMYEKALRKKVTFRTGNSNGSNGQNEIKVVSAEHPVVRTHPETGRKSLFVNSGSTQSINGLSKSESDTILNMLFEHIRTPEFQVRFHWKPNNVVMWDNRCTQHYALADYWPHKRVMYRATIADDARPA